MESFKKLGLSEGIIEVIKKKGFEEPTPIQKKIIPLILSGTKDIVGQAQTGTGKTAAFGLPMIELLKEKHGSVQGLVLAPTRELAVQVAEEINSLKGAKQLSIVPIYGGQSMELQLRSLRKGVDIVVGTPGRILDHLRRRTLKIDGISFLVLDEADEMLNMGFIDEVKEILEQTNPDKRTMLFSATMPHEIEQIAKKYMKGYDHVKASEGQLTVGRTDQLYFEVAYSHKFDALCRIIDFEDDFYGLVFCRTINDVDMVATHLSERGYDSEALHGDMSQNLREKILEKFKKRSVSILVATDVAARGIDIQDLSHVINYSLPQDSESYIHRIGRTGRAGKEGIAITFVTPDESRKLQIIRKGAKTEIRKAQLPAVKDVIENKKIRIKNDIGEMLGAGLKKECSAFARDLLGAFDPESLVASLLQYSFEDELDEKSYAEIGNTKVDNNGRTRLFVTHGKQDGLTPGKLIELIKNKCNIRSDKIKDIHIGEKFAFVTLPFHEAEVLLSFFTVERRGKGPFIKKAEKPRK